MPEIKNQHACLKCGSVNVDYNKYLFYGKNGKTYHYKLKCNDCGASRYIKRDKVAFEVVKEKKWLIPKRSFKRLNTDIARAEGQLRMNAARLSA